MSSRQLSRVLLAATFCAALSLPVAAQSRDNLGNEFFLGFMPNQADGFVPETEVHLTAPTPTMVTLEYPFGPSPAFTTTVAVNPGSVTIVTIPNTASTAWVADSIQSNVVRATAAEEFVAYTINRVQFTSDAALGLPVDALNTDYIAMGYPSVQRGAQTLVTAVFDNTNVTITPNGALIGRASGVPFTVNLDRGESYYAETPGPGTDLTGTRISSDRPVAVVNGSFCANVPPGTPFCDHSFETAHPVQSWGTEILFANLPNRPGGSIYRVLASVDNTQILLDGAPLTTLNAGQFFEFGPTPANGILSADQPIFACQFMTGQNSPGATLGDPAMGNMIPSAQYQTDYTFSTVGGAQFAQNFLTIFAADADVGSVELDGTAIAVGSFSPIPGSGFSVAIVPLADGTHTTSSPSPHGITVEGYNNFDSYIYPGGALFEFINPAGDANPPVCQLTFDSTLPGLQGTATDDRPSEDVNANGMLDPGEDLNSNGQIDEDTGIFSVSLDASSVGVALSVAPFTPGDPSVSFTVTLVGTAVSGTAVVNIEDGAGNTTQCSQAIGCNGTVERFGTGVPGTAGLPQIDTGCPQIDSMRLVRVSNARPLAHGCLLAGLTEIALPVFSLGILYVDALAIVPHEASAIGDFTFPVTYPDDPALIGGVFLLQAFYVDPLAVDNISFTEALRVTIGDKNP
jgi:hypothetical protein